MKVLIFCFSLFMSLPLPAIGQDLRVALRDGDVEAIGKYLDSSIEICYQDEVDFYDRDEAKAMLTIFFKKHIPKEYKEIHSGSSRGSSYYTIGLLNTTAGQFRVYLYFKKDHQKLIIQEIRFDLES